MISLELYIAFVAAALAVVCMPGPTVLLVTGYALSSGLRPALLSILGVCLGDAAAMTLTLAGLGAVLAASAKLFVAMKWVGAAYLVYLGLSLWRAPVAEDAPAARAGERPLRVVARAFTVNVLHPKGLAFYALFLPQFISRDAPALPQMLTLGATFVGIAVCVLVAYAMAASRLRAFFSHPRARRALNRSGAGCLAGAGLYTASLNRGT